MPAPRSSRNRAIHFYGVFWLCSISSDLSKAGVNSRETLISTKSFSWKKSLPEDQLQSTSYESGSFTKGANPVVWNEWQRISVVCKTAVKTRLDLSQTWHSVPGMRTITEKKDVRKGSSILVTLTKAYRETTELLWAVSRQFWRAAKVSIWPSASLQTKGLISAVSLLHTLQGYWYLSEAVHPSAGPPVCSTFSISQVLVKTVLGLLCSWNNKLAELEPGWNLFPVR